MTVATSAPERRQQQRRQATFRPDIQGLRAIAVGAVVIYHLWPGRLVGGFVGVDVFFVVSGFLITTHLLQHPPARIGDFVSFWGRRVRRLLPASLLVLFSVAVAAWFIVPRSMWQDTAIQAVASAFYVQNWALAFSSVDYLAKDNAASAVQHFWSLSVEEQFYFVWPLLIAAFVIIGARRKRVKLVAALGVALVFLASLAYSGYFTLVEPAMAYFVTPTRMWELAAGGLAAILAGRQAAHGGWLSSAAAWAGLVGIISASFIIRPDVGFPGLIALWPVLSTVLVLVAHSTGRGGPHALLAVRPVQLVGDTSYSIYLWHWPLLTMLPFISGSLGLLDKAVIIATTMILAILSYEFVETRFRRGSLLRTNGRTFIAASAGMVIIAIAGGALFTAASVTKDRSAAAVADALNDPSACAGAEALMSSSSDCDIDAPLIQDPAQAKTDKSQAYADECWSSGDFTERPTCRYGDGSVQVALVGNSHAGHWLPALQKLAESRDWTITTYLASVCSPVDVPLAFDTEAKTQGCLDYGQWVLAETTSGRFDAVITSERQSLSVSGRSWQETEEAAREGYKPFLSAWLDAGLEVLVLRDTPTPGSVDLNVPDCVASHTDDTDACNGTVTSWYWMDPLAEAAREPGFSDKVLVIDPTDWLCPGGECRAVIGGLITYFDASHITASYATTLAPLIDKELDAQGARVL